MPPFIHIPCACGRALRAREDQAGAAIRCWGCGQDVLVPESRLGTRLAGTFAKVTREFFGSPPFFTASLCGVVLCLLLSAPRVGPFLALLFTLVLGWYYQDLMERAGMDHARLGEELEPLTWRQRVSRLLLGLFGVCALLAPLFYRIWGQVLPGVRSIPVARALLLATFLLWFVAPLILLAFNARDACGRVSPLQAWKLLWKHRGATLASLLILPLGFVFIETFLGILAWYEGVLPLLLADLYPIPHIAFVPRDPKALPFFHGELYAGSLTVSQLFESAFADYFRAMGRGFFLTGMVPASLTSGSRMPLDASVFASDARNYFVARLLFSVIAASWLGCVLWLQSTWLGLIVAMASRRTAPMTPGNVLVIHPQEEPIVASVETPHALLPTANPIPEAASPPIAWSGVPGTFASPAVTLEARPGTLASQQAGAVPASAPMAPGTPALVPSHHLAEMNGSAARSIVGQRLTILIIDDERAFAHAIGRILAERGYAVMVAGDFEEGLRQARAARPDLIVLDMLLPDRPGLDLCPLLHAEESTRQIPIIVATYKAGAEEEVNALSRGADDFIAKPYAVEVLIARIEKQLARRRPAAAPQN